MITPRIIGLSGKARHGKDSICEFLDESLSTRLAWNGNGRTLLRRVAFADPVKAEARSLGWNGEKDDPGRTLLQEIGVRRRGEDPLYWVKIAFQQIENGPTSGIVWVITDVRFKNEAEFVHRAGGVLWRVNRIAGDGTLFESELTAEQKVHPSETDLDDYDGFDCVFANQHGKLAKLQDLVEIELGLVFSGVWWV